MNIEEPARPQQPGRRSVLTIAAATAAAAGTVALAGPAAADDALAATAAAKPTIVLVHGAWAAGSSFDPVTGLLQAQGYTVVSAPNPLRGLKNDADNVVAYVKKVHPEPVILVGHSYGGMVITAAATELPNVKGLVYIDAYAPETGESALQLTSALPGSALSDPPAVFDFVSYPGAVENEFDTYIKTNLFRSIFAASVPSPVAKLLATGQEPVALSALGSPLVGTPAWKTIPSWYFVGTDDQVIPPAEQRVMAARAGSAVVEGKAPHLAMYGQPLAVSKLIVAAAKAAR